MSLKPNHVWNPITNRQIKIGGTAFNLMRKKQQLLKQQNEIDNIDNQTMASKYKISHDEERIDNILLDDEDDEEDEEPPISKKSVPRKCKKIHKKKTARKKRINNIDTSDIDRESQFASRSSHAILTNKKKLQILNQARTEEELLVLMTQMIKTSMENNIDNY